MSLRGCREGELRTYGLDDSARAVGDGQGGGLGDGVADVVDGQDGRLRAVGGEGSYEDGGGEVAVEAGGRGGCEGRVDDE